MNTEGIWIRTWSGGFLLDAAGGIEVGRVTDWISTRTGREIKGLGICSLELV